MEIKDLIKQRREELGLTFEALGNLVGVGKSTVRKWETGMIENMRRDNIIALSKALNISPSILMGWEEIKEEKTTNLSNKEETLLHSFNKLNDIGKNEAIKRVEELTYISKYNNTLKEDFSYLAPVAAHDDNLTDEEKNRMDEIIFKKLKELGKL
nr:helix-turn-helix domain-containing protein [uncultured Romboutsia sp.]